MKRLMTIVPMLLLVFIVSCQKEDNQSKIAAAELLTNDVAAKLQEYSVSIGHYPTEDEGGLNALVDMPEFDDESLAMKWAGPYMKSSQLKGPWGKELGYELGRVAGQSQTAQVWSCGPNGEDEGGTGDDIISTEMCQNCRKTIGKLEKFHFVEKNDDYHRVCKECEEKLRE
jgi:general secretion pathway protein G